MSRLKQSFSNAFESASQKFSRSSTQDSSAAQSATGFRGLGKGGTKLGAPFRSMSGGIGNVQLSSVDSSVSWREIGLHSAVMFFTFLGICCFGAVAGFQSKWEIGVSGLTGFALFASLFTFISSAVMFFIPFVYDKWDRLRSPAIFLKVPRTILIFEVNGAFWSLVLAFATTISAFTEAGCKDASKDPHQDLGDTFQSDLVGWCRTKKAGSIFFWLGFASWGGLLGFTLFRLIKDRRSRPRDQPFDVPGSATAEDFSASLSPPRPQGAAGYARPTENNEDDEESPFRDQYTNGAAQPALGRVSMDPYGAFSGDVPEGYGRATPAQTQQQAGMSRTMQMATYGGSTPDPFSNVRQALVSPPPQLPPLHYGQPQPLAPPAPTPSPGGYPGGYPQPQAIAPTPSPQPYAYQPPPMINQHPPFVDPYSRAQSQAYADPHQPPYPQTPSNAGLPQPPAFHQQGGWQ